LRIAYKQLNRFKVNRSNHCGEAKHEPWHYKEVKALIATWGESNVQEELDGAVRNQAIYQRIAKKLHEQGFERDWKQCRAKTKNLKTKYREVKDHNGETGRGRITCKFYKELDRILGHRPASVPSSLLDTGDSSSSTQVEPQESEEETDGKNNNFHERMANTFT
jgi:hypothetical protein